MAFYFSSSLAVSSSIESFSVCNRIFLMFEPVTDLVSLLMFCRSCFGAYFEDFSIWLRKLINLWINTNFKCFVPETGSMRLLWVSKGRSNMHLIDLFQEFSIIFACFENMSHIGLPVKCELWIRFDFSRVSGWAKKNSWMISQFFVIYFALFTTMSCFIPLYWFSGQGSQTSYNPAKSSAGHFPSS